MKLNMREFTQDDFNKIIIPIISFVLLWACQHTDVNSVGNVAVADDSCQTKPFSLEIAEKKPIFDEKELPKGILLFDSAKVYVEKLDKKGDVQDKVHVSEEFDDARREAIKTRVHCVDIKKRSTASNFESSIPALKKIEISDKGNRLESKNILLKLVDGKVEFNSKLPTTPTGTNNLKEFFSKFGVNYAFYKLSNEAYELRGHTMKNGVSSYIAIQYHLVKVE
ncbi:MAG: hypothetical protein A4S09_01590 [Proteobacteria bacterium SG_bin7]|nr:MAG: hypothetical protein A4S09_01590 [Proteobacteria bacterium SG_bin7]